MQSHVLQLDIQGTPQAWVSLEQAALHYATQSVAWEEGVGPLAVLRGGINVASGRQLYLPYVPSRFEAFLLEGRLIRADVHEWLSARLPKHSRLH